MQAAGATVAAESVESSNDDHRYRPDIDGLRAIAIILVVAYHVGIPYVGGGYIGVDVFFVISGFLISGKLLGDVRDHGTVSLRSFWAGRVRRLVPALAVMVIVVLALAVPVLSPIEWASTARDGAASLVYVSNLVFGQQATNYFAPSVTSSVFLHTWSLSIEEQFYLLWPAVVLVVGKWVRPTGLRRRAYAATFAVGGAITFALAVAMTARGTPWSFFSLPTRAWEFALGALVALALADRATRPSAEGAALRPTSTPLATIAGIVGLGLIIGAAVLMSDSTPHPGVATLAPVAGTMTLLVAGWLTPKSPLSTALGTSVARWIGRRSYSWYLWHWPLILLAVAAWGRNTIAIRGAAALVALGVAALALRLVENPIRFDRRLVTRPSRTFAVGGALTLLGLSVAFGLHQLSDRDLADPFLARLAAAQASSPELGDDAVCRDARTPEGIEYCPYGDANASRTVVLVGDSHAAHWTPAFRQAATQLDAQIIIRSRGGCPSVDVPIAYSEVRLYPSEACLAFRSDTARLLQRFGSAAVVLANAEYPGRILDGALQRPDESTQLRIWEQGFGSTVHDLRASGRRVGVVLNTPRLPLDPNVCLARKRSVDACAPARDESLVSAAPINASQRRAADEAGVIIFDPTSLLCDDRTCDLEHDGELIYRDTNHLTAGYAATQAPAIAAFLQRVLSQPSAP